MIWPSRAGLARLSRRKIIRRDGIRWILLTCPTAMIERK